MASTAAGRATVPRLDPTRQEGLVVSISRSSYEDGPGWRTTVFLKGCPLHCRWCHSPQTQRGTPQLYFVEGRCIRCGACAAACPLRAQVVTETQRRVDRSVCDDCGRCAEVCPTGALAVAGTPMTVAEVADVVARDRVFYRLSGGGVTISGGEPLAQPGFLSGLVRECRRRGIETAVDTCGAVDWEVFEEILPLVDLWLYDLKHMDGDAHERLTGVGNEQILSNLSRLVLAGARVWVRVPLVPGYNDDEENVRRTAAYVARLGRVEQVTLLPFNPATGAKYGCIGWEYGLDVADSVYPQERLERVQSAFRALGVTVEI